METGRQIKFDEQAISCNEEIESTPFRLVGSAEQGYYVTFINYIISAMFETKEIAIEAVYGTKMIPWTMIINLGLALPMINKQIEVEEKATALKQTKPEIY